MGLNFDQICRLRKSTAWIYFTLHENTQISYRCTSFAVINGPVTKPRRDLSADSRHRPSGLWTPADPPQGPGVCWYQSFWAHLFIFLKPPFSSRPTRPAPFTPLLLGEFHVHYMSRTHSYWKLKFLLLLADTEEFNGNHLSRDNALRRPPGSGCPRVSCWQTERCRGG